MLQVTRYTKMAKWVVKRGGKKEPFKASKVIGAIRGACKDAKIPAKRAKTVVNKISRAVLKFARARKMTVKTSDLRKVSLRNLDKVELKAARAWRKYDAARRARRATRRKRR